MTVANAALPPSASGTWRRCTGRHAQSDQFDHDFDGHRADRGFPPCQHRRSGMAYCSPLSDQCHRPADDGPLGGPFRPPAYLSHFPFLCRGGGCFRAIGIVADRSRDGACALGHWDAAAYPAAMRFFRVQADRLGSKPPRVAMGVLTMAAVSTTAVGPLMGNYALDIPRFKTAYKHRLTRQSGRGWRARYLLPFSSRKGRSPLSNPSGAGSLGSESVFDFRCGRLDIGSAGRGVFELRLRRPSKPPIWILPARC
jgi:hypothetical protein